jgi:hypothetical protein
MLLISESDWMGDNGIRQTIKLSDGYIVGTFRWKSFTDWLAWMAVLRNVPIGHSVKFEGNAEVTRCESIWTRIVKLDMDVLITNIHKTHLDHWAIKFKIPNHPEYHHASAIDLPTVLEGLYNNLKEMSDATPS